MRLQQKWMPVLRENALRRKERARHVMPAIRVSLIADLMPTQLYPK